MTELRFITPANEKVALAHPPRMVAQAANGTINYVADWIMDAINDVLGHVDEDIVVLLALWLERNFSKTQILELYLNRVYFGSGAYGIEQASQRYFGKSARQMSLPEAALLAGLVKSPSRLAPTRNFDGAERRAQTVLAAMTELGFITPASEKVALAHPPRVVAQAANGTINYVADWIMDAINDVLGHVDEDIVVRTTIDTGLQAGAEKALTEELAQKGERSGVS